VAARSPDLWASFQHDPRDPAVATLRASDADRDVVQELLTEAFADGRLDREEYDERSAAALQARTLGQLPPLLADLVPDRPLLPRSSSGRVPLAVASSSDLQKRAEDRWREDRRGAFLGFVGSAVLTWAIWIAVNWTSWEGAFPWPLIVNAVAFMNFVRVAANRRELVATELRRLERKQAKEIESRRKKQLGP
jgi:Domain of unknown function (DUF1707)